MAPRAGMVAALLGALSFGCARKAPGPVECRNFALAMFRVQSEADLGKGSRHELALRDRVDELTRECLTLPYDREYLRCLEETGRTRPCRFAFEKRRATPSDPLLSR